MTKEQFLQLTNEQRLELFSHYERLRAAEHLHPDEKQFMEELLTIVSSLDDEELMPDSGVYKCPGH